MEQAFYSVNQLNILFKNSLDFVFFMKKCGDEYEYVYTNPSAAEFQGGQVIGKMVHDVTLPHLAENIVHNYNLALQQKKQIAYDDYAYFAAEVRKYETTVVPIFQQDGEYILAITKEIKFDRDIEDKYLFLRSVFFKTFLSTVLISDDLSLLEANPKFIEDFNINLNELRGLNFLNLPFIDAQSIDSINEYLTQALNGENISSKIMTFVDKKGEKRSFTGTFSPLKNEDKVIAVCLILQEITSYIKQKQELRSTSHGLEMFKMAINTAADVTITDVQGRIIDANERFIKRTGYSREEILGKTHNVVNSGYHSSKFFKDLWDTLASGNVWRGEVRNQQKNGANYWVDATMIPLTSEQGEITNYLTVQFNVSEKKQMMIELRNIERTFRAITENTNDLIVVTDGEGHITYASPSYVRKLGYGELELLGANYKKLLTSNSIAVWETMINKYNSTTETNLELQLVTKTGESFWTEGNYTIVYNTSANGISEIIMVSREITERKELENKLMFMAYHDSLTQLPNRRYLQREFPHFVENANTNFESLALFYIDGDNFKNVNDRYGHDVGDKFLKQFSSALSKSVRSEDLVVRIGGDEFVVIVTGLPRDHLLLLEQLDNIIERIRMNLKQGWHIQNHYFSPTSSIGISLFPEHTRELERLIELADQALYEAKEKSKNNYKISSGDLGEKCSRS